MSERQWEVFQLLAEGWSPRQIADELHIATVTVRSHTHEGCYRLKVSGIRPAIALMAREGWLGWRPPAPLLKRVVAAYIHAVDRHAVGDQDARAAMRFYAAEMRRLTAEG